LHKYQFTSLINRLPKHMKVGDTVVDVEALEDEMEVSSAEALVEADWPTPLILAGPVYIELFDDVVWVSTDGETVHKKPIKEFDSSVWRALEMGTAVSYDLKALYHTLDVHGITVRFVSVHDLRQGAFLIDPL